MLFLPAEKHFRGGNGMRAIDLSGSGGIAALRVLGIWQIFFGIRAGKGALLVQKYTDINDFAVQLQDLSEGGGKGLARYWAGRRFRVCGKPGRSDAQGKTRIIPF